MLKKKKKNQMKLLNSNVQSRNFRITLRRNDCEYLINTNVTKRYAFL